MAGHTNMSEAKKTVKLFPHIATFSITLTYKVGHGLLTNVPAGLVKMKYINILYCLLLFSFS